jgi:glutathione S-transferase
MPPTITIFKNAPDGGRALTRDMRVRWALEEAEQPYQVRLVSFMDMKRPAHRRLHPFGLIPTYEDGDLSLFESGAIVLHIAEQSPGLLPIAQAARARALSWMFAAMTTIEPPINQGFEDQVRYRLHDLSHWLGASEWLEETFSAGDLLMIMVLRSISGSRVLAEFDNLSAYVARGEARAAFVRAFSKQIADSQIHPF